MKQSFLRLMSIDFIKRTGQTGCDITRGFLKSVCRLVRTDAIKPQLTQKWANGCNEQVWKQGGARPP